MTDHVPLGVEDGHLDVRRRGDGEGDPDSTVLRGDRRLLRKPRVRAERRSAQNGQRKWWWKSDDRNSAYDLARDPGEERDESTNGKPARPYRNLAAELDGFVESYQGPVPLLATPPPGWMMPGFEQTIDDPELLERLRALGYVN